MAAFDGDGTGRPATERGDRRRKVAVAVEDVYNLAYAVLVADNYCDEDLRRLKKLLCLLTEEAEGK